MNFGFFVTTSLDPGSVAIDDIVDLTVRTGRGDCLKSCLRTPRGEIALELDLVYSEDLH